VRPRPAADQLGELSARRLGDVEQRAERSRRAQRLAGAPQHAHAGGVAEAPEQRRLADARLAGDEHEPARAAREQAVEERERLVALQQRSLAVGGRLHRDAINPRASGVRAAGGPAALAPLG
jgi:hypothetical protein